MIIFPAFSFYESFYSSGLHALAYGLDGALEAGGSLQLQLVGHGVDLEPVQPVGSRNWHWHWHWRANIYLRFTLSDKHYIDKHYKKLEQDKCCKYLDKIIRGEPMGSC